jgi:hypothetical protein
MMMMKPKGLFIRSCRIIYRLERLLEASVWQTLLWRQAHGGFRAAFRGSSRSLKVFSVSLALIPPPSHSTLSSEFPHSTPPGRPGPVCRDSHVQRFFEGR